MSTFSFCPKLNQMEDRSLMSATLSALPAEPVPYRVELENVLISSVQPTAQTREHILLARQVGVPSATVAVQDGTSLSISNISGDTAADRKTTGAIVIHSYQ